MTTLAPTSSVLVRYEDPALIDAAALRAAGASVLLSRVPARWGSWQLTEAMVEALREARRALPADHYVIVSGQDYPIRHLPTWESQRRLAGDDALLDPLDPEPDDYEYRWWIVRKPRLRPATLDRAVGHLIWRTGRLTSRYLLMYQGPHERVDGRYWVGVRRPRGPLVVPVKCSQWMTLSDPAVEALLAMDAQCTHLRAFFQTVRISDESYLQTLLLACRHLRVGYGPTSSFHMPAGRANADWLDVEGVRRAARSGAAFARKVPVDVDPAVLAEADAAAAAEALSAGEQSR